MEFVTDQFNYQDAETLTRLVEEVSKPGMLAVELGTYTGRATLAMLPQIQSVGGRLFCVDWFKGNPTAEVSINKSFAERNILDIFLSNIHEAGFEDYVTVIVGTTESAVPVVEDESLDFIFIDADHRYTFVRNDILDWYPKLKNGGIICGHDFEKHLDECDWERVLEKCEEDYVDDCHYGVIRAVCELFPDVNQEGRIWYTTRNKRKKNPDLDAAIAERRKTRPLVTTHQPPQLENIDAAAQANTYLVEANYKGFNIVMYKKRYYALSKSLGAVEAAKLDADTLEDYQQRGVAVVAADLDDVRQRVDALIPELVKANYQGFNILRWRDAFYALSGALGSIDITQIDDEKARSYQAQGLMVTAADLDSAQARIDWLTPELIQADYQGYNILRWRDDFYALSGRLGAVDITHLDADTLKIYQEQDLVIAADTAEQVQKRIHWLTPELVAGDYQGYNILRWKDDFYGLAGALGAVDITRLDSDTLNTYHEQGLVIQADSVEQVQQQINWLTPELVQADYQGFNILHWKDDFYGLAGALGAVDITHLDSDTLNTYHEQGLVVIAESLEKARQQITWLTPELVEGNYQGFNILRWKDDFYGLAGALGVVDITRLDADTLNTYQEQDLVIARDTAEQVQKRIHWLTPELVETSHERFNILRWKDAFYGLAGALGAVDITRLDSDTLNTYHEQGLVVMADSLEKARQQITWLTPELVEGNYQGFNILRWKDDFYGLAGALGVVDITRLDSDTLNTYQRQGLVITADTTEQVREQINWLTPELVEGDYHGFNILRWKDTYYGLAGALGVVDITRLDADTLNTYQEQDLVIAAETQEQVRDYIHWLTPELVQAEYKGFNILRWKDVFYALSGKLGAIDVKRLDENTLRVFNNLGLATATDSLESARQTVDWLTPELVQSDYQSFNIVRHRDSFFALSSILGRVDVARLDEDTQQVYQKLGLAAVADSLEGARQAVDWLTPELIETDYQGFNILRYQERFYGFSRALGTLNITRLDADTLRILGERQLAVTASAADEVRAQISALLPQPVIINYEGFNIVAYHDKFYAIAAELGTSNPAEVNQNTFDEHLCLASNSLETLQTMVMDLPPMLARENYLGFNIVRYRGVFYGLALSLGVVDLRVIDEQTLNKYMDDNKCIIGASLEDALHRVAEVEYEAQAELLRTTQQNLAETELLFRETQQELLAIKASRLYKAKSRLDKIRGIEKEPDVDKREQH